MRRRLLFAIMGTALLVLLAFGAPLAVVGARLVRAEADRRLQKEADAVALAVEGQGAAFDASAPASLAPALGPLVGRGTRILLVLPDGRTVQVAGPRAVLAHGVVAESPTYGGTVVRLESPAGPTDARVRRSWALLAGVGAGAVVLSVVLATVLSRQLTRPLRELADVSSRLGQGDFRARAATSGVGEMDTVAERLNASTEQLARMMGRERDFSANASHQLRTALTALRIPLEELAMADDPGQVRHLTELIIHQADRLQATIEDLLNLAHGQSSSRGSFEVGAVVAERVAVWAPVLARLGRQLVAERNGRVIAEGSPGTLGQVLDILIDNAHHHGQGDVHGSVHVRSGSPVVRVSDDGPGIADGFERRIFERGTSLGAGRGIGLAMARDLLIDEDGRLVLARARPATFEVFLARPTVTRS